jgi:methylenetetrahydrofolate reductase (NADPH)
MPVTNVAQIERFTKLCGATIPVSLRARLAAAGEDDAAVVATGIEWATEQSVALLRGGVPGIHFYTLNRSHSSQMVFENLYASGALARA